MKHSRVAAALLATYVTAEISWTGVNMHQDARAVSEHHRIFHEILTPSARLGFTLTPGLWAATSPWNWGHDSTIDSDEHGFRNPLRTEARVCFIGDSFTFGVGVNRRESFVGLLEAVTGPAVNLGIPSYGVPQYEVLTGGAIRRVKAKVIVICLYADDLSAWRPVSEQVEWFARMRDAPSYEPDPWRSSMTYSLGHPSSSSSLAMPVIERGPGAGVAICPGVMASLDYFGAKRYEAVEAGIARIINMIRNESPGTRCVIALIPSVASTYRVWIGDATGSCLLREKIEHQGYARIATRALMLGASSVCDMGPAFQASTTPGLYFRLDGHFAPAGHALAAECLRPFVAEAIK